MKITIITPNIVTQKGDFFGTGIPYIPFTATYLAAYLIQNGHDAIIIDSFGEAPMNIRNSGMFFYQGLSPKEIKNKIPSDTDIIVISAERVVAHQSIMQLLKLFKRFELPIIVVENSQAVSAYSVQELAKILLDLGAKFIIAGEPEYRTKELIDCIKRSKDPTHIDGLIFKKGNKMAVNKVKSFIEDLDELPFPAWHLLPMKNYWSLGYAHAPLSSEKYLPILTSRGCPYNCRFCVIPTTNQNRWRPRSPTNVVTEIQYFHDKMQVKEFHLEDLNPTVDQERIVNMCCEIIKRKLDVIWKIGSGTKLDAHFTKETISLMARSGCKYISFSPESGSKELLSKIGKPFNYNRALRLVRHMNRLGIITQACFVLGFPGEKAEDLAMTKGYIKKLTKSGIDEIALFIFSPVPGSYFYTHIKKRFIKINSLTFSPIWRKDFKQLNSFRTKTYFSFFIWKLMHHPLKIFRQVYALITRNFVTKMEMTFFRLIKIRTRYLLSRIHRT
ncbi:radical SAM protein [Candidatus Woesearchaeota archaeon]|nr:radical SAM protein [Candidatus Woesearchaeota archaeon]